MATLGGFAAGGLMAGWIFGGFGPGFEDSDVGLGVLQLLLVGGGAGLLLMRVRRRGPAQAPGATVSISHGVETISDRAPTGDSPGDPIFERGLRDIRRTDPGFDPTRFAGYTGMMFRDAQTAWMRRDIESLRARTTPELYGELQGQCERLRATGQANRVEGIDIVADITEAWQENGRDYVTAYIAGSIIDYTVDEATDSVVYGSRTVPRPVEEFWTFTRSAGLNFWMLSAIQS
jgi:predicted lipid-binding transport protein (Tim44 family)